MEWPAGDAKLTHANLEGRPRRLDAKPVVWDSKLLGPAEVAREGFRAVDLDAAGSSDAGN